MPWDLFPPFFMTGCPIVLLFLKEFANVRLWDGADNMASRDDASAGAPPSRPSAHPLTKNL